MLSYRNQLKKIGEPASGVRVSYRGFFSRPSSLRKAMLSMDAPQSEEWSQWSEVSRSDEHWTDEIQGVAWDGSHWIFSSNANQVKPAANDKAIYAFKGGSRLLDDEWTSMLPYHEVPHPVSGLTTDDDHWGQVCFYNQLLWVSHFWTGGASSGVANVVRFRSKQGQLQFVPPWIQLAHIEGRKVEFQAINPWDNLLYTCFGDGDIDRFFMHDETGAWTGKAMRLRPAIKGIVQGACFSPNGHLYIATNERVGNENRYQAIWYYSALNGRRLGVIEVLAEEDEQELEGLCFADITFDSFDPKTATVVPVRAQIHVVLLENEGDPTDHQVPGPVDDLYFKSFRTTKPDWA